MENKIIQSLTPAELDLYCGLLPLSYKLEREQTGLVCGTTAEAKRDRMFKAIMEELSK